MQRVVIKSRVGNDGVLHLNCPLGVEDANREVKVIIEPIIDISQEEWVRRILENAGTWQGEFDRGDPGEHVERDPMS